MPINLVMGEKLPRLRLKTHPATAIFSQHLRITRNCRSFVPFHLSTGDPFPGNPRAVHCLTPRAPCRDAGGETRGERERERRGIIVMSNRKLTLNRGPSTVSFLAFDPWRAAKKNTLAPEYPFTQPGLDHPCRIGQLLKFPRDYRRALSGRLDPLGFYSPTIRHGKSSLHNRTCYSYYNIGFHRDLEMV